MFKRFVALVKWLVNALSHFVWITHQSQFSRKILIHLGLDTDFEKLIVLPRLVRVLAMQAVEVLSGCGIDDFLPDLSSNLAVLVQDAVIREALVDSHQGVKETSHICNTAGKPEAATLQHTISRGAPQISYGIYSQRIADMGRVRGENDSPHSETRRAPLLHLIWADVRKAIFPWLWVSRENFFVSHFLALDILFAIEPRYFGVGDPVEAVVGDFGDHMPVCRMDDEVAVPVIVLVEIVVHLSRNDQRHIA